VVVATLGNGSVWDLDFSRDGAQTYLYASDGENTRIWRPLCENGKVLSRFARSGPYAGELHWVHNIAADSKGNLYSPEMDDDKRAQKFVYRGLSPPAE